MSYCAPTWRAIWKCYELRVIKCATTHQPAMPLICTRFVQVMNLAQFNSMFYCAHCDWSRRPTARDMKRNMAELGIAHCQMCYSSSACHATHSHWVCNHVQRIILHDEISYLVCNDVHWIIMQQNNASLTQGGAVVLVQIYDANRYDAQYFFSPSVTSHFHPISRIPSK